MDDYYIKYYLYCIGLIKRKSLELCSFTSSKMKFSLKTTILISLVIKHVNTKSLMGGEKIKCIGMYSICRYSNNRTTFNDKAFIFNKTAMYIFSDSTSIFAELYPSVAKVINYISYDICTMTELKKSALDIMLNEKYFVNNKTENPPKFNRYPIRHWKTKTDILFIATYLILYDFN